MLSAVRENLKGTLVVVVVIIFIVPMVISGVGTTFLGGLGGEDVASVNGEAISKVELDRAIRDQRNRLQAQGGIESSSPFLTAEYLRAPVLENLTHRLALITMAEKSGMTISDAGFAKILREQEDFYTDGKFDKQKYRELLLRLDYTPTSFRMQVTRDLILGQQTKGLLASNFITETEYAQIVKLNHQKRSFYAVKFSRDKVNSEIDVTEDDLIAYYEVNTKDFVVPEKVSIEYLELNLDELASGYDVDEQDILDQYDAETTNFSTEATYTVAHILVEDSDPERIAEISEKINAGVEFAQLAESYSDDIATHETGGMLGVLTPGMFPKEFEQAVLDLAQGEVSAPVKTEAGTHFIKAVVKTVPNIPSLEERREDIAKEIAKAQALEDFPSLADNLGDLTFSSVDLSEASSQLGLEIKSTSFFDRNTGSGLASNSFVRAAAFSDEVLIGGNNSNIIEISDEVTIVLRVAERKPEYIKSLEEVKPVVESRVTEEKLNRKLASLASDFEKEAAGNTKKAKALAEQYGYEFSTHELVKRSDISVDRDAMILAFSKPVKTPVDSTTLIKDKTASGDYWVIGITDVVDGRVDELNSAEKRGLMAQLSRESATFESAVFTSNTIEKSKIKIN